MNEDPFMKILNSILGNDNFLHDEFNVRIGNDGRPFPGMGIHRQRIIS